LPMPRLLFLRQRAIGLPGRIYYEMFVTAACWDQAVYPGRTPVGPGPFRITACGRRHEMVFSRIAAL
jgi:hypothetical protein